MTHEASSSSSFSPRWKYDVFLNYHGKDTRNNITAHLFDALQRYGIRTFRDDEKLKNREIIFSELMNEIEGCRIAIPVISENYASSISCLTELVKILQCKRNGQTVLPIFHNIDLSDVKYQKNNFADAFVRRKEEFQKKMEKLESWDLFKEEMENVESWELFEEKMRKLKLWKLVKKEMKEVKLWQLFKEEIENEKSWKTALTEVADLKGFQIENDAKLIKKIVGEVSKIVNETDLHVKNSIGLDSSHLEGILRLLNDGLENVHFLGIYGPAGIGKTTIAKVLYNKMLQSFGGSCSFLVMAEGVSRKQKSLVTLQKQLLFDVLGRVYDIDNEHRGVKIIQHHLPSKKVLIVLDDVDEIEQLENLVGGHHWFGMGSRIIVTTRDEHVLICWNVDTKYQVYTMNQMDSLQLFSLSAFGEHHPPEGYESLTKKVVEYTGGLPLALEVLGSHLSSKSQDVWESELKKLEKTPNKNIFKILDTNVGALDEHNRIIFLDISCFFIGFDKDDVVTILDACNLYANVGIKLLMERSLLTINEHNKICMHDMIRDVGREIVRRESPREPGERSRLWDEDAIKVWRSDTGTDAIEGFEAQMSMLDSKVEKLQLTTKAFFKMKNLRLFRICDLNGRCGGRAHWAHCDEHDDQNIIFKKLVWLCWEGFPFKYIPNNFHMANLVILDLQSSRLKNCWMKTTKYFPYLKILNLSNSLKLEHLDFSCVPNLEKLILRHCLKLIALDESIGHLTKLVELDLFHCKMLDRLPNTFGYLTSLRKLVTSKCHFRENLPDSICKFSKLRTLDCSYSPSITSFPNLSNMKHLRELNLSCCQTLNEIRGISKLSKLETLRLWSCKSLTSLPNLSHLKHLRELNLSDCPSLKKIENLEDLESAETINLSGSYNFARLEMFEVISKDFRNHNICHFYLPDWEVFQNKLLNLQPMMTNSATSEVGHVPNMEIQGVIIHGVYVPCQNFDNYPQVVVDNRSKKFTRKREAEEISFVSSDKVKDWVIKIPNLVWKSFAECGDFINVSFKTVQPCVWIQVSVHFFTLQEMISYNGKSGPEKEDHHRFIEKDDRFFLTSISAMQETNKLIKSE